jgi:pyruvate dehydrogenase (quinone)
VQIDIDARRLSLRYPMEVSLVGDSAQTLRRLKPLLRPKADRSWQQRIEGEVREWWKTMEQRAQTDARPINPERVFAELSPRLPDRAIVTCDSGTAAFWYARHVKLRPGMQGSVSGGLASMGCAVPYAIAAKFAYPDRPAVALVGDGAMQMNGINELITAQKYAYCYRKANAKGHRLDRRNHLHHRAAGRAWRLGSCLLMPPSR